jgi:hypothetical protein
MQASPPPMWDKRKLLHFTRRPGQPRQRSSDSSPRIARAEPSSARVSHNGGRTISETAERTFLSIFPTLVLGMAFTTRKLSGTHQRAMRALKKGTRLCSRSSEAGRAPAGADVAEAPGVEGAAAGLGDRSTIRASGRSLKILQIFQLQGVVHEFRVGDANHRSLLRIRSQQNI